MSEEVEEGEEHGKGLLQAEEAVERPFAVELLDRVQVGWLAGEAVRGCDVLASVVAGGGAVPVEEVVQECCVGDSNVSIELGGGNLMVAQL